MGDVSIIWTNIDQINNYSTFKNYKKWKRVIWFGMGNNSKHASDISIKCKSNDEDKNEQKTVRRKLLWS